MILYLLRGFAISLSMFVLLYALLRFAVAAGWPLAERTSKRIGSSLSPNSWYALQVGPFVLAALVVLAVTIPSFVRFEPATAEEEFGLPVVLLSVACLLILGAGIKRTWTAYSRTARIVKEWRQNATLLRRDRFEVLETGTGTPALVVAGLIRPRLLVSSSAARTLSKDELTRAMAHETTHIQNRDNLKKLMLRLCSFPINHTLERNWLDSIELAADQNAVSNKREALDLASALVKASRLSFAGPELTTNLTSGAGQLLNRRVERLLAWDGSARSATRVARFLPAGAIAVMAIASVVCYQFLLLQMHSLAEILMR